MESQTLLRTRNPRFPRFTRGLVGLAILAGVALAGVVGLNTADVIKFGSASGGAAIRVARDAVQERLTAPGSAKFKKSRVAARTEDGTYHVVYIEVDSQNRMGALLRTYALVSTMGEGNDGTSVIDVQVRESSPRGQDIQALIDQGVSGGRTWIVEEWVTGSEYRTRPSRVVAKPTAVARPAPAVPDTEPATQPPSVTVEPTVATPSVPASPRYERLTDSILVADFAVGEDESAQEAAPRLVELGKDLCLVPGASVAKIRILDSKGKMVGQLDLPLTSFLDFHSPDPTDRMIAQSMWGQNTVLFLRNAGLQ